MFLIFFLNTHKLKYFHLLSGSHFSICTFVLLVISHLIRPRLQKQKMCRLLPEYFIFLFFKLIMELYFLYSRSKTNNNDQPKLLEQSFVLKSSFLI